MSECECVECASQALFCGRIKFQVIWTSSTIFRNLSSIDRALFDAYPKAMEDYPA